MRGLKRPVIFGEVLFDCFPDGSQVLGGAPFNVAWHLQGLGLHPITISRVGDDERGTQVLEAMRQWGLSAEGVQIDASRPTGVVDVSLEDGQPSYNIRPEQAFDYIDAESACGGVGDKPLALLYHGTLALRAGPSAEAVAVLQEATGIPTFLDMNLRAPWWTEPLVRWTMKAATWLKLNENELALVTRAPTEGQDARRETCRRLLRDCELTCVFVTRGEAGAESVTREGRHLREKPSPVVDLVDTVGAGDAFSAVVLSGLIRKWPPDKVLHRAVWFAAEICRFRGATTFDRTLYDRALERWRHEDGVL